MNVNSILTMSWTKKHDNFALSLNLSESRALVLRDILRKSKLHEPSEIEIDVRDTNKWIGKNRLKGEFHRKTITTAIPNLDECSNGMVTIMKQYSPWVYKILVRPLSFLEKLESAKCASTSKLTTTNPMFDSDHKKRARELLLQNISKLDTLLKKLGMNYSHDALARIWRMAGKKMSEVEGAIKYMLAYHADRMTHTYDDDPQGIRSPKGFLHDCLKYSWHHFGLDEINLPILGSISEVKSFVRGLLPQKAVDHDIGNLPPNLN